MRLFSLYLRTIRSTTYIVQFFVILKIDMLPIV